jgi:hypothetical protein
MPREDSQRKEGPEHHSKSGHFHPEARTNQKPESRGGTVARGGKGFLMVRNYPQVIKSIMVASCAFNAVVECGEGDAPFPGRGSNRHIICDGSKGFMYLTVF